MTIYKARKVAFGFYLAALALLLIYMLLSPVGILRYLFLAGGVVFVVLGYRVATKYCRCPKCGHVQQIGLLKIRQCAICSHPIDENTTYHPVS